MYRRILVPLDGSERAEQAISIAARLARGAAGTVILLRVAEAPAIPAVPTLPANSPTNAHEALALPMIEAAHQVAADYLAGITRADSLAGIETETYVEDGPVAASILDAARARHADLIVLCSHGRTGFARWALGSVAEKVARHADVPVLLLRSGQAGSLSPKANAPIRALVPLDGSKRAESAAVPAAWLVAALAASAPAELRLLHVITPHLVERNAPPQAARELAEMAVLNEAKEYVAAVATRLQAEIGMMAMVTVTSSVRLAHDVAQAITEIADTGSGEDSASEGRPFDIVAMATHGRTGLDRWALGSITERVMHASKTVLLIVRPQSTPTSPPPPSE